MDEVEVNWTNPRGIGECRSFSTSIKADGFDSGNSDQDLMVCFTNHNVVFCIIIQERHFVRSFRSRFGAISFSRASEIPHSP